MLPNISVTGYIPFILCQDSNRDPQNLKNNLPDFYMDPCESISSHLNHHVFIIINIIIFYFKYLYNSNYLGTTRNGGILDRL